MDGACMLQRNGVVGWRSVDFPKSLFFHFSFFIFQNGEGVLSHIWMFLVSGGVCFLFHSWVCAFAMGYLGSGLGLFHLIKRKLEDAWVGIVVLAGYVVSQCRCMCN